MIGERECFSYLPGAYHYHLQLSHVIRGVGGSNSELVPGDHEDSLSWCDHFGIGHAGNEGILPVLQLSVRCG
jgi:hypothetical protein